MTDRATLEPGWLSGRDYSESKCCGRAPGSCPDCPMIVQQSNALECSVTGQPCPTVQQCFDRQCPHSVAEAVMAERAALSPKDSLFCACGLWPKLRCVTGCIKPTEPLYEECLATQGQPTASAASKADNGGLRYSDDKPRYELIPPEALEALAWHYTIAGGRRGGSKKYPDRNWERGMAWLKCFGSLMRHSWQWMRGENYDQETGSHHMIAVAWNAFTLFTYAERKIGTDDRPDTQGVT